MERYWHICDIHKAKKTSRTFSDTNPDLHYLREYLSGFCAMNYCLSK